MCLLSWKTVAILTRFEVDFKGLWKRCMLEQSGEIECKKFDSSMMLSWELHVGNALIVSMYIAVIGIILSCFRYKCVNFAKDKTVKVMVSTAFFASGFLCLITVSVTANSVYASEDLEFTFKGASLYFGWATAGLLMMGGALICCAACSSGSSPSSPTGNQELQRLISTL